MTHIMRVRDGRAVREGPVEEGTRLSDALRELLAGRTEAPCGGKGLCGKCWVRVSGGGLSASGLSASGLSASGLSAPDEAESRILPAAELASGTRLACRAYVLGDLSIELPDRGEAAIVTTGPEYDFPLDHPARRTGYRSLGVGADIGTTTVVCRLVDLETGERLGAASGLNDQRSYGADVISRIAASEEPGGLEALRDLARSQLARLIASLVAGAGAKPEDLISIAVAGNPTMLHFLAGVSPSAIARAPFTPAFTGERREDAAALGLVSHAGCLAVLLPGVSGYVGADIVAGMAAIRLHEARGPSLYLDLGTNGEMAFGGRDGILCCAAAAGPAFEGAGMERGTGGVEGAIDSVWLEDGAIRFGTIGRKPAVGICGSGLVEALAAFLDAGLVDETGRIGEGQGARLYLDRDGDVYLSQADIRAAQLAKAAIAAGIETLLRAAGKGLGDVDRLYLAGGFGSLLDAGAAVRIGLLPPELADRILVVGNAACAGAAAACSSRAALEACSRARDLCEYLELSGNSDFNAAYVERMAFPEGR